MWCVSNIFVKIIIYILCMKEKINIVGSGIAGLSCAFKLINNCKNTKDNYDIHIYEATDRIGGQLNTKPEIIEFWLFLKSSRLIYLMETLNIEQEIFQYDIYNNYNVDTKQLIKSLNVNSLLFVKDIIMFIIQNNFNETKDIYLVDFMNKYNLTNDNIIRNKINVFICILLFYSNKISLNILLKFIKKKLISGINILTNIQIIVKTLIKYLKNNKVHFHLNSPITKHKHKYFSGDTILKGKIVIAVDPYNAKKHFGIKIPKKLQGIENDFRYVYAIKINNKKMCDNLTKKYNIKQNNTVIFLSKWKIIVFLIIKNIDKTFSLKFIPQTFDTKGINGKTITECNKIEFENEIICQLFDSDININDSNNCQFIYPDNIKFIKNRITNTDISLNMFTPIVGTDESLTPIKTKDENVFLCGVYVENSDFLFTIDSSIETGFNVADIISLSQKNINSSDIKTF